MVNLYFECTAKPPRIVDDAGNEYTPEQARTLVDTNQVVNCNLAFTRLASHNYDIAAAMASLDPIRPRNGSIWT